MSTIFIPTDFRAEFLQIIPSISKAIDSLNCDIILGHLFKVKDYEKLYWKKNIEFKNIDPAFVEECEKGFLLQNSLSIKNFIGSSVFGLKVFFEVNRVDIIINPVDYAFKKISKHSIDNPGKIIKRSGYPTSDVHTLCNLEESLTK